MPFYSGDWGKGLDMLDSGFYNMDCVDGIKQFPDKYFELAIVDPPYSLDRYKANDGGNSKKIRCFGGNTRAWNNAEPTDEYFAELFRVSKYQIIWGANNFDLPPSEYFIIWDKLQMMPSFARCEMAWTNCRVPAKIFQLRSQDAERIHPTQKPIALYRWLLSNYANDGDKILDTHVGSASSLIACHQMGFEYWGFELDADYYKAASERLEHAKAQVSMFDTLMEQAYEQIESEMSL
jgi:site-specific DNA-methyltransferase (adenine-specific)